ncbi:MFS transporter [Streptomyces nigra]|uniref:MFS transporter n=1 Tax=Streptomyces nigra TaxID=1827580 RepID=UPI00381D2C40
MPRPLSSLRLILAVLAGAAGVFAMLQSLISPVLPTIQADLGTSRSTVTWVLTAWLMSASVATPLLGRLGDSLGKRRTLLVALGAVSAGSLLAALAPNIGVLVAARVVQGLGGAVFPLAFGIVRDEFPGERVAPAIGSLSAVLAGGGGLGLVLSGPIETHLGWRWLFWIPMVAVALTAVLVRLLVPESPVRHHGRIDWRAALLLSGWLVALLTPVSRAGVWGWGSPSVLGLFALAAILFCCWIAVESRSADPLVDLRMMRLPAVWTTNAVAVLFGASMFAVTAFVPQFLQTPATSGYGFGLSVSEAGLLSLPMLAAMSVGGILSGALSTRVSPKAQLVVSALLSTVACAAFALLSDHPWEVDRRRRVRTGARTGLRRHVDPDRPKRTGPPDGRGHRHERQYSQHRRGDRHRRGRHSHHIQPAAGRTPPGERVHPRIHPADHHLGSHRGPRRPGTSGTAPRHRHRPTRATTQQERASALTHPSGPQGTARTDRSPPASGPQPARVAARKPGGCCGQTARAEVLRRCDAPCPDHHPQP